MASLNKVMIMGNLTRDPEVRYTPKGQAVVDIGLAVNRRYKVENETREEVTFIDVTFWGRSAEIISQYMKKGRPLYVEGRLRLDQWENKTTKEKRSRMKVVLEQFQFLGDSRGGPGGGGAPGSAEPGIDQTASPERHSPRSAARRRSPRPRKISTKTFRSNLNQPHWSGPGNGAVGGKGRRDTRNPTPAPRRSI